MRSRLTLQHLEAFVHVAELLNFRKAAEAIPISQPALSRTIQGAEEALNTRLFDRDTRNVRLTPVGAEFLPIAKRLLTEFQTSLDEVSQHLSGDRGRLVIAALPSIGAALLPEVVCDFARSAPAVRITLHAPHTQGVIDMVMDGEADFGIAMQPPSAQGIDFEHLMDDDFVLICARDHILAKQRTCEWRVFAEHPFIALSSTTSMHMLAEQVFRQLGLDISPSYQGGGLPLTGSLVAAGLGITAIPKLALPQMGDVDIQIRPLRNPVLRRSLGIITRAGRTSSMITQNFLSLLRKSMRQHPASVLQNHRQAGKNA